LVRAIQLTGLAAILLLNFSGLAVAHLGETPDHVKERLGKPTEILGSDGVPVPAPGDFAYLYFFPGVASQGCDQTDEDDLKGIVSRDRQCLARTNDPLTPLYRRFQVLRIRSNCCFSLGQMTHA
jgi:hypothetical protein